MVEKEKWTADLKYLSPAVYYVLNKYEFLFHYLHNS